MPQSSQPVSHGSTPAFGPLHPAEQWGRSTIYRFDGGAGSYLVASIAAFLVILLTLGIMTPFAIVIFQRWRADHTLLLGRRLAFTGSATHLFGLWIKWWFLMVITLGIYSFWVVPRMQQWMVEHTDLAPGPAVLTSPAPQPTPAYAPAPAALPQHTGPGQVDLRPDQVGAPAQDPAFAPQSNWYR